MVHVIYLHNIVKYFIDNMIEKYIMPSHKNNYYQIYQLW
jgi:hypothetical protein